MRVLSTSFVVAVAGALLGGCAPAVAPAAQPDAATHAYQVEVHNTSPERIDFYYQEGRGAPVLLGSVSPTHTERFQFAARSVQRLSARPSDGVGVVECRSDPPEPDTLVQVNCQRDERFP